MKCVWHLCDKDVSAGRQKYCSDKCKVKTNVQRYRKRLKVRAVAYKGGSCELCGYDRCIAALEFHHNDGDKEFGISSGGHTRPWAVIVIELDKCKLLCANCHRELHSAR